MLTKEFNDALIKLNGNNSLVSNETVKSLKTRTSARIGVGQSGCRPVISEWLQFRVDHAAARDSIYKQAEIEPSYLSQCLCIKSSARDKEEYLLRPDLGRKVHEKFISELKQPDYQNQDVLLLLGDGLSAYAIEENLRDIIPSTQTGLSIHNLKASKPIFIQYARVGIMDHIGDLLQPKTVILLIGERPGLRTAKSMSAYLCYQPNLKTIESDRDVISNIHVDGLAPVEAGAMISDVIADYIQYKASGLKLKTIK